MLRTLIALNIMLFTCPVPPVAVPTGPAGQITGTVTLKTIQWVAGPPPKAKMVGQAKVTVAETYGDPDGIDARMAVSISETRDPDKYQGKKSPIVNVGVGDTEVLPAAGQTTVTLWIWPSPARNTVEGKVSVAYATPTNHKIWYKVVSTDIKRKVKASDGGTSSGPPGPGTSGPLSAGN